MAISGHLYAQITARAGVARAGTARCAAVGDAQQIRVTDNAPHAYAGEFHYTESPAADDPEDAATTTYTNIAS